MSYDLARVNQVSLTIRKATNRNPVDIGLLQVYIALRLIRSRKGHREESRRKLTKIRGGRRFLTSDIYCAAS